MINKPDYIGEPWIGVDLDGTLAEYHGWFGIDHIGNPIKPMVDRVKRWIEAGVKVKIFTARVCNGELAIQYIKDWLIVNGLPDIEITNQKDFSMVELWDDRCVCVKQNTGEIANPQISAFHFNI